MTPQAQLFTESIDASSPIIPVSLPSDGRDERIGELEKVLAATIERLGELEKQARQFDGVSSSMDLRSLMDREADLESAFREVPPCEVIAIRAYHYFKAGWKAALAAPIPEGPELPTDPDTWARMRRALKFGRTLSRLAQEASKTIGKALAGDDAAEVNLGAEQA